MPISYEERREIAARLRLCARDVISTCEFGMYLSNWVGLDDVTDDECKHFTVAANRREAELTLEKLADLIDRPTCHICDTDHEFEDSVRCDRCRMTFMRPWEPFKYCPECGARVVTDDE